MKKFFMPLIAILSVANVAFGQKTINDPNAEKRNVNGYNAIEVSSGIDLYLSQGEEAVAVSASEIKYRDRIITEVINGVLKIRYETGSNLKVEWGNRKLKAYVSFKNLEKLVGSGGSDIYVDGSIKVNSLALNISGGSDFDGKVEANQLKVNASGGSDVKISGRSESLSINASGGSDFKGYELSTDVCDLIASGGSDIYITINKELSAHASGGSDVYYKGNGVIKDIRSNGSSSVKKVSK